MVPDEIYDALKAKAVWAKQHIRDLDTACTAYARSDPYTVERKHDSQAGEFVYYLRRIKPIPPEISLLTGNILSDLRNALDHAASYFGSIAVPPVIPRGIYFPIKDSALKYLALATVREVQALGDHFKNVVDSIKPYKGGNSNLWKLHALNNIDKHRLLLTVAAVNYGRAETRKEWEKSQNDWTRKHPSEPFPLAEGMRRCVSTQSPTKPLKAGDELLRISDTELDEKPHLLIEIAMSEVGIVEGELLMPLLHGISNEVTSVIGKLCK